MTALRLSPEIGLTEEDKKLGITTKIRMLAEDCVKAWYIIQEMADILALL